MISRVYSIKRLDLEGMGRGRPVVINRRGHWIWGSVLCVRVLNVFIGYQRKESVEKKAEESDALEGQKGVDFEAELETLIFKKKKKKKRTNLHLKL